MINYLIRRTKIYREIEYVAEYWRKFSFRWMDEAIEARGQYDDLRNRLASVEEENARLRATRV